MRVFSILILILTFKVYIQADPNIKDTRLLSQPTCSENSVAFTYDGDLWIADIKGGRARRLTSHIGSEGSPVFSPDGQTIAFSGEYDGNVDVYLIPITGGVPTRLTWHPGTDIVRDFTPDGNAVLFSSAREVFTNRYAQLFTVPVKGGMPTKLLIPHGVEATFSPDGNHIAYTPLADRTRQWKNYRGGTHSRIWIYHRKDHSVEQIPQPKGRCNDLDPQWIGNAVYFRSDRNGEYNLFAYDRASKSVSQLTQFNDFPILDLGSSDSQLVFEQSGYLHVFNPESKKSNRLTIGAATERIESRSRYVKGAKHIRSGGISPSGARAVFEVRGEIVTVPAKKGDPRNLTLSTGVHERSPQWSPDGKSIAYFSDEGGEYQLHVRAANGKGKAKVYKLHGNGFYEHLRWSPDSKNIAFVDNSLSMYWMALKGGKVTKIASEPIYGPVGLRTLSPSWSPDSKWIAYSLINKASYHAIYAYHLETKKSHRLTDALSDAINPVFDANGKYLYFLASTDAGPVNQWFAQSNADMQRRRSLYLVVLKKGEESPLAPESDEEKIDESDTKDKDKKKEEPKTPSVTIDMDGIDQRILALPIPSGNYRGLEPGTAGQLYYHELSESRGRGQSTLRVGAVKRFDLKKRKSETIISAADFVLSNDKKKALIVTSPENWSIVSVASPKPDASKGKLKIDAIEVRIDPLKEWPQIFSEAWRINRDYFYDPKMHGANWPKMKKKYEQFLPHIANRRDLDRVIQWMLSELAVGHSYLRPGERLYDRKRVPGGLLGADYEIANGRYRFKKVYGGLNWSPELRSPLTVPGVGVKAGEYLLAVQGKDLKPPTSIYSLFENTASKRIEITVGPNPDGKGSRTVTVKPLSSESSLRNRDWVEGNLKKVHKATNGRVAYVYVPNTAGLGHTYFKRYFFPQAHKDAIIVDERFNGGGQVADYYIDHLRRPFTAMWTTRYGEAFKTPGAAIHGPKVMLIDETAGSGGDLLPWMFRKYKLGPLIGKRTWGGLVGILGFPVLMDGGSVTAPNLAFWTPEEGYGVENVGVPPDIEVEQLPIKVINGHDPQLDKAIEVVLKMLKENPPKKMTPPPFPIRVRK